MYAKYGKEVQFFMVYIKEAHPSDGRQSGSNVREGIVYVQPKTLEERTKIAAKMCATLKITLPAIVDGVDNKVNTAYSAGPDRLYLIDADGKIAFKSEPGPWGFKPAGLEEAIAQQLKTK
jgi:hypothetical protein